METLQLPSLSFVLEQWKSSTHALNALQPFFNVKHYDILGGMSLGSS